MRSTVFFILIILGFSFQNAWSASPVFKFSAGTKVLELNSPQTEWTDFCFDKKMGCARFKYKENAKVYFGVVKVLSDKVQGEHFEKYCANAFNESWTVTKTLTQYKANITKTTSSCMWTSPKDLTQIFWKNGITIMITTSDKTEPKIITSMIEKAKIYAKP